MPRLLVYQVRITPRAHRDLDGIVDYLKSNASDEVAANEYDRLLDAMRSLRTLPYRFAVPRFGRRTDLKVRAVVVLPYVVRYRIEETPRTVQVLTVRHGARRPLR